MKDKYQQQQKDVEEKLENETRRAEYLQSQKTHMHSLRDEPVDTYVQSQSSLDLLISAYKKLMKSAGETNILEPEIIENELSLKFASKQQTFDFFSEQAAKLDFVVVDKKTQQVIGYSENGKLFHGNGEPALKSPLSLDKSVSMEQYHQKKREIETQEPEQSQEQTEHSPPTF